ncbi:MAG: stress response translation initiation inhibitor YciH [Aureliella sp.]
MGLFDGTPLERPVLCDECMLPEADCKCPPKVEPDTRPEKQRLKIRVDKRKRGKLVTVITGFSCRNEQMQATLTRLKDSLGTGGTIQDKTLELQGDQTKRCAQECKKLGYVVK